MYNQIKKIFKNNIIEDIKEINSLSYYYFYKDYTCKELFGVSKKITNSEYQLLQTLFIEKKLYNVSKKEQAVYEYLFEEKPYPFKENVSFIVYSVNEEDEESINNVLKEMYKDVVIIKYLNYNICFSSVLDDIKATFNAFTLDLGYEVNVHKGFKLSDKTKGIDLSKYLDYYKNNIKIHGFSDFTDIVILSNNKDSNIIKIIKDNVLNKLLNQTQTIDLINALYNNNLNVSLTSKLLYMHRNTLLSKIEQIEKLTELNILKFKDAYVMKILLDY